uniref:Alternative protein SPATA2 n=1 Tax=Homo sapiens TaxID=9606 RepID=L8E7J6_HUMAN|nr:alternative protein SPATA2 [Homo sapiens]
MCFHPPPPATARPCCAVPTSPLRMTWICTQTLNPGPPTVGRMLCGRMCGCSETMPTPSTTSARPLPKSPPSPSAKAAGCPAAPPSASAVTACSPVLQLPSPAPSPARPRLMTAWPTGHLCGRSTQARLRASTASRTFTPNPSPPPRPLPAVASATAQAPPTPAPSVQKSHVTPASALTIMTPATKRVSCTSSCPTTS